jgi:hypothetical protein
MSINYATSTRIARFGRGAVVLRGRTEPLDEAMMRSAAPTLFADGKHSSRSDKYSHIPTFEVLRGLAKEGFRPYEVRVGGSGDADKRAHTKHLIRLRSEQAPRANGSIWELVLLNSHDGTSAYKLMSGFFRMVCSNGLITADELSEQRVPHKGDVVHKVIEGAYTVLNEGPRLIEQTREMAAITLTRPEQLAFAEAASELRWPSDPETGTSNVPVRPEQVIYARREEDRAPTLWNTFNVAEEALVNGGLNYSSRNARGTLVHRTARAVNGVDQNVGLNRALWILASRMRELKSAA